MPQEARIKLTSTNLSTLENVCSEIKDIGEKNGIKLKGPHPLPTKKMRVVTENLHVDKEQTLGTSTNCRVHRRVIDLGADDRSIRQLMRLKIPEDVYIEVSLTQ